MICETSRDIQEAVEAADKYVSTPARRRGMSSVPTQSGMHGLRCPQEASISELLSLLELFNVDLACKFPSITVKIYLFVVKILSRNQSD